MKQQFLVDIAGTFKTCVYDKNLKLVPASATVTVYKPGSTDKLIDAAAMTVAADGLLSYALTTAHNDNTGEDYRAVVAYVVDSEIHSLTLFYDVVNTRLVKVIIDDDVVNELPSLKENNWRVHGTATGGSTTTIVDSSLKRFEDDHFTGGLARNFTNNETSEITGFVSSTGTVTHRAATSTALGHKYVLQRSYGREIQRAFEKIEDRLRQRGKRAHLVLDPYDLREVHIYFSVAEVCKGLAKDGAGSFWWEMWKDYENKGRENFDALSFKYDASGDGVITGAESKQAMKTIKVKF